MKNNDYYDFCETMYKDYVSGDFDEDPALNELFQLGYIPEPYFTIKEGDNPLYLLLTNPGSGMDFQLREKAPDDYRSFAKIAREVYLSDSFKKGNAYRRIQKSIQFAEELGFNGVVNLETIPFHSNDLNKYMALVSIYQSEILIRYKAKLKSFLKDKPVLIVSACGTKKSITKDTLKSNQWLKSLLELAGVDADKCSMKKLTKKGNKVTSALFQHNNKRIALMMGSNNLPKVEYLKG